MTQNLVHAARRTARRASGAARRASGAARSRRRPAAPLPDERHLSLAPVSEPHILIIVQNLPVPFDRRVWLECQALVANGYRVSVICPKGPGDPAHQVIDGVSIHKYRPAPQADGMAGYAWEFVYCWARTAALSVRVRRQGRFDAIQACNPPDTYWALARLWRLGKVKFVFDQHDLNPELYLSRFGEPATFAGRLQLRGLRWLEAQTYRAADHVISTNESYKAIATGRGRMPADEVTVVRSGPDTRQMRPVYPTEAPVVDGRRVYTLTYLGIMGPQDGVDVILDVMEELTVRRGRTDVRATLMGFGDCLEGLQRSSEERGLSDRVTFTGRADKEMIARHLSAADVGLCPDLKTPLNDVSTMNKTMEYMAYALPCVAFDLVETRVSGGEAALFVDSGDVTGFADAVERLLDDPELRTDLGMRARERVATYLDWRPQAMAYVEAYRRLVPSAIRARLVNVPLPRAGSGPDAPAYVDLDDRDELRRFVRDRSPRPQAAAPVPTAAPRIPAQRRSAAGVPLSPPPSR